MKILIILSIVVGACHCVELIRDDEYPPKDWIKLIKEAHIPCRAKTGVDNEKIKEFSDADLNTITEDDKLKCYMQCLFEELEMVDGNKMVDLKIVRSKLPESLLPIARKFAKNCSGQPQGENLCEKAFWYHRCWKSNEPSYYFLY